MSVYMCFHWIKELWTEILFLKNRIYYMKGVFWPLNVSDFIPGEPRRGLFLKVPASSPQGRGEMGRGSWTLSNQPGCHGNLVTMATRSERAGYHGNQLRKGWLSRLVTRAELIYDDVWLVINVCILIIYIYFLYNIIVNDGRLAASPLSSFIWKQLKDN